MMRTVAAASILAIAVFLCACSGGDASKAGGDAAPITLRMGTDDAPGRPAAAQIEEFARQVDALSNSQIVIEPVWNADGPGKNDWDQLVARMVVSGDLDLGMIPARAWDTEGVTSLRALQAPFLITTNDLLAEVVTSDLAGDMLAGLDQAGVIGLALVPEGMRAVFSFGEPLLTPEHFSGLVVRAPTSDTTRMVFDALGATVGDFTEEFSAGVDGGTIGAAESSLELAADSLPRRAIATGDLTLFPKVNSLVVNNATFAALTEDQQSILRDAAAATREYAVGAMADPAQAAAAYCGLGGTVVVTGEDNMAAFRVATEPVYTQLESDQTTKSFIERLRDLASDSTDPAIVTPCGPAAIPTPTPAPAPPSSTAAGGFPEGVYRTEMSTEALLAAGLPSGTASAGEGIHTLTFQDGEFMHEVKRVPPDQCRGTYAVDSGRVVVTMTECGGGGRVLFDAAWSLEGTTLKLLDLHSETDTDAFAGALWGSHEWEQVG